MLPQYQTLYICRLITVVFMIHQKKKKIGESVKKIAKDSDGTQMISFEHIFLIYYFVIYHKINKYNILNTSLV